MTGPITRFGRWLDHTIGTLVQGVYDGWDALWLGRWP